jgi:hypothetical protein
MIVVRRYAEFSADFPDDTIWNEGESRILQTGGKAIAEAIAEIMDGFGCTIDKLEDYLEHGWECSFSYEGLPLMFQVVNSEPAIFILERPRRVWIDHPLYTQVLLKLNEHLRRDGRFHDLTWYLYDDRGVGKEGFEIPVAEVVVEQVKKQPGFFARLFASRKGRSESD